MVTIQQLISTLQRIQAQHENLPVYIYCDDCCQEFPMRDTYVNFGDGEKPQYLVLET